MGTESGTVKAARKGYVAKAKERPQQFQEVVDKLRRDGPIQTYRAVMKKLDALSSLGYSCVGEITQVPDDVRSFALGETVACGGSSCCLHRRQHCLGWRIDCLKAGQ